MRKERRKNEATSSICSREGLLEHSASFQVTIQPGVPACLAPFLGDLQKHAWGSSALSQRTSYSTWLENLVVGGHEEGKGKKELKKVWMNGYGIDRVWSKLWKDNNYMMAEKTAGFGKDLRSIEC